MINRTQWKTTEIPPPPKTRRAEMRLLSVAILFLLIAFGIGMGSGCSATGSIKKSTHKMLLDLFGPDEVLKKRIVVAPFFDLVGQGDLEVETRLHRALTQHLKNTCSALELVRSERIEKEVQNGPKSMDGPVDNLEVAWMGRDLGLNGVVTGALWKIDRVEKKKGIYGFRRHSNWILASVQVWVYDTQTGSKLLDEEFAQAVEIDAYLADAEGDLKKWPAFLLEGLIEAASERICERLGEVPWTGYIGGVNNTKVIIQAGRESGLQIGDMLEIFSQGDKIAGIDGMEFMVPGPKIGELRVTRILPDRSEGEIIKGNGIAKGDCLKLKE